MCHLRAVATRDACAGGARRRWADSRRQTPLLRPFAAFSLSFSRFALTPMLGHRGGENNIVLRCGLSVRTAQAADWFEDGVTVSVLQFPVRSLTLATNLSFAVSRAGDTDYGTR